MTDTFTNRQKDFANFVINYNKLSLLNIHNPFLGDLLTNEYFIVNDNNTYQFLPKTDSISDLSMKLMAASKAGNKPFIYCKR